MVDTTSKKSRIASAISEAERLTRAQQGVLRFAALNLCSMILGYIASVTLARRLGVEAYGQLMVAQSIVFVAATICDLGMNQAGMRLAAESDRSAKHYLMSIMGLQLSTSVIAVACFGVLALLAKSKETAVLQFVAAIWLLPLALTTDWFFIGRRRFLLAGIARVGTQGLLAAISILFIHSPSDVLTAASAKSIAQFCGAVALACALWNSNLGGAHPCTLKNSFRELLASGFGFLLLAFAGQLFSMQSTILVGVLGGSEEAGFFAAAFSIAAVPTSISSLLAGGMLPMLIAASRRTNREYAETRKWYLWAASLAAVVTLISSYLIPAEILTVVFGSEYADAANCLPVLLVASAVHILNGALAQPLIALRRERIVIAQLGITILLAVATNVLLTPKYGATGAAIAHLASVTVGTVLLLVFERRK